MRGKKTFIYNNNFYNFYLILANILFIILYKLLYVFNYSFEIGFRIYSIDKIKQSLFIERVMKLNYVCFKI